MSGDRAKPKRRSLTEREKEALRQKRLRDQFGSSPVDPGEPDLPKGLPRAALKCAFTDARQIHGKPRQRFSPGAVAKRTAGIVGLSEDQEKALKAWLGWLNDRRFVTRDPYQSPVLLWALSDQGEGLWDADPDSVWRDQVDMEHATRKAAAAAAAARTGDGEAPSRKQRTSSAEGSAGTSDRATQNLERKGSERLDGAEHNHSLHQGDLLDTTAPLLDRPKLPSNAFIPGKTCANAFFTALDRKPDEQLYRAARNLLERPADLVEVLNRGLAHRRCVERVYSQFDLPLPDSIR